MAVIGAALIGVWLVVSGVLALVYVVGRQHRVYGTGSSSACGLHARDAYRWPHSYEWACGARSLPRQGGLHRPSTSFAVQRGNLAGHGPPSRASRLGQAATPPRVTGIVASRRTGRTACLVEFRLVVVLSGADGR